MQLIVQETKNTLKMIMTRQPTSGGPLGGALAGCLESRPSNGPAPARQSKNCNTQIIKLIKELIFLCDLPSTFETCD
jgi:hypothetical protein